MTNSRATALVFGFVLGAGACGPAPTVHEFKVRPLRFCGRSDVHLQWRTSNGATTLSSDPSVTPALGSVGADGTMERSIDRTTKFKVSVKEKGEAVKEETAERVPPGTGEQYPLSTFGSCIANALTWVVIAPPDEWQGAVTVSTVANPFGQRAVQVAHANVVAVLPAGGATAAFAGTRVQGDWHIRPIALNPGEGCGGGVSNPQTNPSLGIVVNASCEE